MNEVFILGAGFSKAISSEMPLTCELSAEVIENYKHRDSIESDVQRMISEDFEKALTFLAGTKPWLPESTNLRHKALYLDLTTVIRGILHGKSRGTLVWGTNAPPLWLEALITYWHKNQCSVITLNYDTLIERVASSVYWKNRSESIPTGQLYPIDLTPAAHRGITTFAAERVETFRLFKLHGSVNWFYSGQSDFHGEELYFVPCEGGVDGAFDACVGSDPEKSHWIHTHDKTALIIPPVLDKSVFFQHESLRSMWFQASQAIKKATRVVCMGYSLPGSDLTMAQFLKTSAGPNRTPFEIVDVQSKCEHFSDVLGENAYEFNQKHQSADCIPHFVIRHCLTNAEDKAQVIRMTVWKKEH